MRTTVALGALLLVTAMVAVASPQAEDSAIAQRRTPVVAVFERCRDAVVNISSTQVVEVRDPFDQFFQGFFDMPRGRTRTYKRQSVGSGFVLHQDGYIVTNAHVVSRTAERKVIFADGREYPTELVASDPEHDIAVLKIQADRPLPTLALGRSDDLMIGETVIAIGNPLGYQHTVTAGVVSATDRDLEFSADRALTGLIQTDASINPGNSGGPLLNVLGELIGVNTAIRGDAQNIGFAIPVDQLRTMLPELLDVERRYRIVTGMRVGAGLEPRVTKVVPGSPADLAGVCVGDLICAVDGQPVHESVDFQIALIGRVAGERVELGLKRAGRDATATLTLVAKPPPDGAALALAKIGIEVHPLPAEIAARLGLPDGAGLFITDIDRGSPADEVGLAAQDILISLNGRNATSLEELGQLLEYAEPGELVTFDFLRLGRMRLERWSGKLRLR